MQVKVTIEVGDGYTVEAKIEQTESLPKLLQPAYGEPGYGEPQTKVDWPTSVELVGEVVGDALTRFSEKLAAVVEQDKERVARARVAKQEEADRKARLEQVAA